VKVYLTLAGIPGILRITASQLIARFPLGMLSLAVLLHIHRTLDSFALAGLVVGSLSIGEAVAVPLTSRLLGRFGIRGVVMTTAVICAAALVGISAPGLPFAVYATLGFVAGAAVPPITPAVRALYPQLVPAKYVNALFALDTSAQELIWITGPVLATLLATAVTTAAPLVVAAVVTVGGSMIFVSSRRLSDVRLVPPRQAFGRVLRSGVVTLALVTNAALVASFTALEIALVAHFSSNGAMVGIAIAISSAGSLIGGLALGRRPLGLGGLAITMSLVALATGLAGIVPGDPLLILMLFLSGLGFAPSLTALYAMVSRALPPDAAVEAFGWLNTGALLGAALGTALAGILSDPLGAAGAFAVATGLAVVGALCPLVARPLLQPQHP
jgi:MFS family permease